MPFKFFLLMTLILSGPLASCIRTYQRTLTPLDPLTKRFRLADVPVSDTWAALEKLVKTGKIRRIGVSNFTVDKIQGLLQTAEIPPAVNQIEAHPYLQQPALFKFLKGKVRLSL